MEVKQQGDDKKGMFFIEDNGKQLGTMTYIFDGEKKIIIEHTIVNEGNEGKGLGKMLVNAGVAFARKNNYKILPLCPYAKKVLEKTDEYKDVLF